MYPFCGYILVVLMHTIALDKHWGFIEITRASNIYFFFLCICSEIGQKFLTVSRPLPLFRYIIYTPENVAFPNQYILKMQIGKEYKKVWGASQLSFTCCFGGMMRNVSILSLAKTSSLSRPFPSSTSNLPPNSRRVAFVM